MMMPAPEMRRREANHVALLNLPVCANGTSSNPTHIHLLAPIANKEPSLTIADDGAVNRALSSIVADRRGRLGDRNDGDDDFLLILIFLGRLLLVVDGGDNRRRLGGDRRSGLLLLDGLLDDRFRRVGGAGTIEVVLSWWGLSLSLLLLGWGSGGWRASSAAGGIGGAGASFEGAGLGEDQVGVLGGGARVALCADVGPEHDGEFGVVVELSLVGVSRVDFYRSTAHVHLPVADIIEPSPHQHGFAGSDLGRNLVVENMVGGAPEVASRSGGASSLEGLQNAEDGVGVWLGVVGDGNLARATAVDGRALEDNLVGANAQGGSVWWEDELRGGDFAWKVGSVGLEGSEVIGVKTAVGKRAEHADMSGGRGGEGHEGERD